MIEGAENIQRQCVVPILHEQLDGALSQLFDAPTAVRNTQGPVQRGEDVDDGRGVSSPRLRHLPQGRESKLGTARQSRRAPSFGGEPCARKYAPELSQGLEAVAR